MGKVIQSIIVAEDATLFLTGFNKDTNTVSYRDSREPKLLQEDEVIFKDDVVKVGKFWFHEIYWNEFLKNNNHEN